MKCTIDGCPNEAGVSGSARGWCRAHYRRWQRYGTVDEPLRRIPSWKDTQCAVAGCNNEAKSNGLCGNHYATQRRRNNPEAQRIRNLAFKKKMRAEQELKMGRPRPSHCELCGSASYGRGNKKEAGICFDHDHKTGKARGWLCDRCNKMLGLAHDDIGLLKAMVSYLEEHVDEQTNVQTTEKAA
jgi:hypothetical protein